MGNLRDQLLFPVTKIQWLRSSSWEKLRGHPQYGLPRKHSLFATNVSLLSLMGRDETFDWAQQIKRLESERRGQPG